MTRRSSLLRTLLVIVATVATLLPTVAPDAAQAARKNRKHAKPEVARAVRSEDINAEVVRGLAVPDGKYPFVTAIGTVNSAGGLQRQFCGGSLIAPSYVLTAAHCVAGARAEQIAVVVGQTAFGTAQGEARTVAAIAIHPGFSQRTLTNDVAVLQLNAPVLSITPASLVRSGDSTFDFGGSGLTLVGWGNTARSSVHHAATRYPDRLKEAPISVVDDASCTKKWRKIGFKKKVSMSLLLCTTARRFGSGDSGSPLFSTVGGTYVQVSLVSGGFVGTKKKVSDFGPQLSEPSIAAFIASSIGA